MKGNALQYKVLPLVLQSVTVYHTKYYLSKNQYCFNICYGLSFSKCQHISHYVK